MKYALSISAALLMAAGQLGPAQAQAPRELVNQAIAAEGGLDALRGLKGLAIKADALHWEPGQSKAPAASRACSAPLRSRSPGISPMAWRAPNGIAT